MALSKQMKALAEEEVKLWARQVGMTLQPTGVLRDQTSMLTVETLYRRLQEKYPEDMAIVDLDDLKRDLFSEGDYYNNRWFSDNMPPWASSND